MVGVATSTLLRSVPATAFPSRAIWQTGEGGQWVGLQGEVEVRGVSGRWGGINPGCHNGSVGGEGSGR